MKTYVPKSRATEKDGQFGPFLKIGFHAESLIEFVRAHKNQRGYINLIVSARRNPDPDGATHSVYLDTYEPGERKPFNAARDAVDAAQRQPQFPPPSDGSEDVPF